MTKKIYETGDVQFDAWLLAKCKGENALKAINDATIRLGSTQALQSDLGSGCDLVLETKALNVFATMNPTDPEKTDLELAKRLDSLGSPIAHEFLERVDKHIKWKSRKSPIEELREGVSSVIRWR